VQICNHTIVKETIYLWFYCNIKPFLSYELCVTEKRTYVNRGLHTEATDELLGLKKCGHPDLNLNVFHPNEKSVQDFDFQKCHGCQTFILGDIHFYLNALKIWHKNLFLSGVCNLKVLTILLSVPFNKLPCSE